MTKFVIDIPGMPEEVEPNYNELNPELAKKMKRENKKANREMEQQDKEWEGITVNGFFVKRPVRRSIATTMLSLEESTRVMTEAQEAFEDDDCFLHAQGQMQQAENRLEDEQEEINVCQSKNDLKCAIEHWNEAMSNYKVRVQIYENAKNRRIGEGSYIPSIGTDKSKNLSGTPKYGRYMGSSGKKSKEQELKEELLKANEEIRAFHDAKDDEEYNKPKIPSIKDLNKACLKTIGFAFKSFFFLVLGGIALLIILFSLIAFAGLL